MRRFRATLCLIVILVLISPLVYAQSKESGALKGTIRLEDGNAVPGVLVTLSSEDVVGSKKSTVTNTDGEYRFIGLQPGTYSISASLEGFASAKQAGINVHIGKTFEVDLTMKQGKITEEIEVLGKTPTVDVKDSATATVEMTTEYLQNIPNSQFTTNAVNLAPGITNDSAYGAASGAGISYQIDGVDVKDPAGGTAWVFLDYNVVEEISISGIGAAAEYGGFTGVVFNTVTKSGGNNFKGYAEFLYQGREWNKANSPDPAFTPSKTMFYSAHADIGGPIVKDKLSFFLSALYTRNNTLLSGTDYNLDYKQPKAFLKFTWSPSAKTRINTSVEIDTYDGSGRGGGALVDEDATRTQKSPEIVGSLSFQHNLSDYSFLEAKLAYFDGYFALNPVNGWDVSGHGDYSGESTVNAVSHARYDRTRLQLNASLSHHAENFIKGSHDFKFGVDLGFSKETDQYGYNGGAYYYDYYGSPYLKFTYEGYNIDAKMDTYSGYIQDSWTIAKGLTINPGLRIDHSRGYCLDRPSAKYVTKPSIAPRIGFAFDVLGDHSTALKAHWGRYFESAYIYGITSLSNSFSDKYTSIWTGDSWYDIPSTFIPGGASHFDIDKKIKQSYMDQFTVGVERQLMKDLSVSLTYILRKNYDHISPVNDGAIYETLNWVNPATGETIQIWNQINDFSENHYQITNPVKGYLPWMQYTPSRKYSGIEFLLNKRFSNKWQMMASYVYSKATGNFNNTGATASGYNSTFQNPNNQINAQGKLSYDPTHMLKIQATVILPFDINFNMNFQMISGLNYTKTARIPLSYDSNRTTIYAEPRGKYKMPMTHVLDLRLEKTFKIGNFKLGLLMDFFNLFNEGKATSIDARYQPQYFGNTLAIQAPFAYRAGIRFWF